MLFHSILNFRHTSAGPLLLPPRPLTIEPRLRRPRNTPAQPGAEAREGGTVASAGNKRAATPCHPAHVLTVAERLASLRTTATDAVDAAHILARARENARIAFPALGLLPCQEGGAAPLAAGSVNEAQTGGGAAAIGLATTAPLKTSVVMAVEMAADEAATDGVGVPSSVL